MVSPSRYCVEVVRNCTPGASAAVHKNLETRLCDTAWAGKYNLSTSSELERARLPLDERMGVAKWPLRLLLCLYVVDLHRTKSTTSSSAVPRSTTSCLGKKKVG